MATDTNSVRSIIGDEYPSVDLTPFVNAANLIITEDMASSGLSQARLDLIASYLGAHFAMLTLEHGQVTFSKTGDSAEYYGWKSGSTGLQLTRYGQTALSLDSSGTLANAAASGPKAEFKVIGVDADPNNVNGSYWDWYNVGPVE